MATTAALPTFWILVLQALLSFFLLFPAASLAQVPDDETFRYVNSDEFGDFITEYDASYRMMPPFGSPYQLAWYNTTPGQFYVGLRMGLVRHETIFRWVWDANRGRPVGEGATLTFGKDGNLVLAEADGKVVWSTGTANKGVVGFKIIPIQGNIVLYDKNGRYVWQSFDHPTDTLMPGQTLYLGGPTQLVSRRSAKDNSNGIYRLALDNNGLNLYLDAPNSKSLRYSDDRFQAMGTKVKNATFQIEPQDNNASYMLEFSLNGGDWVINLARPTFNASIAFLRLTVEGNLQAYIYYEPVDNQPWVDSYIFFAKDWTRPSCDLPTKCGALGLCENEMCVACPTQQGLLGWSSSCSPPTLNGCKNQGNAAAADYYKIAGVGHFIPNYNKADGKMKMEDCRSKCTADCNCLGFFYWTKNSTCWLAPVLGSLARDSDPSHEVYIKYLKLQYI